MRKTHTLLLSAGAIALFSVDLAVFYAFFMFNLALKYEKEYVDYLLKHMNFKSNTDWLS